MIDIRDQYEEQQYLEQHYPEYRRVKKLTRIYLLTTIIFLSTTLLFLWAWLDMMNFVKSIS